MIRVGSTDQSASVWSRPPPVVARGYVSLTKVTPCPMKTSSSMVTPSQMNVWLDILQLLPTEAFFWIFDESADLGVVADGAAVEVNEL